MLHDRAIAAAYSIYGSITLDIEISRLATAFKHPRCGGLVHSVEVKGRTYFECDRCLTRSDELAGLAVGKPVILRRGRREDR